MVQFPFAHVVAAVGATFAVSSALAQHDQHQPGQPAATHAAPRQPVPATHAPTPAEHAQPARPSDPYPLTTCPVTGEVLGSMGDPIVKDYDGREVRFCCGGCVGKFEAAQDKYWATIDEQIVQEQLPFYPVTTCVVSGESLGESGEDTAINYVYRNRLVRFCCSDCVEEFLKDPEPTLAKLDAAVIQQQRDGYPLQTCLVSGEELNAMGGPIEIVIGNRLVRLCCTGCEADLRATPLEFLPILDKAWAEHGMPEATDKIPEAGHDEHNTNGAHGGHEHHGG